MTIQTIIISIALFIIPFFGSDIKELNTKKTEKLTVCTEKIDINGMLIEGCMPNMGYTCTIISSDGTFSFGASPTNPTKPVKLQ
tara:strand:+ start:3842 stop:4093 length:252 start_codon:yes stop_codon:yes gene_type:complete